MDGAALDSSAKEQRVVVLDGLRGMMTILVVISHYFGEVPHGISSLMFGWIAVDMFFVLSGYLVGKLILEKSHHDNFFQVFYTRRVCRTFPIYFVSLTIIGTIVTFFFPAPCIDTEGPVFPLWSYFTFTQNFFMLASDKIGLHWLAPTWTLSIEEQFYLFIPALFFLVPRRILPVTFGVIGAGALVARCVTMMIGDGHGGIALAVLLPNRADILVAGLLAAVAIKTEGIRWGKLLPMLRIMPVVALVTLIGIHLISSEAFDVFGPALSAAGCAVFLLTLVLGAPEAKRFHSKFLCFFNTTSYAVYLTHLPVLGLMHGLILGATPDLTTPVQWLVTLAALPVCTLVAWVLTVTVERPLTEYGRTFRWSGRPRQPKSPEMSTSAAPTG